MDLSVYIDTRVEEAGKMKMEIKKGNISRNIGYVLPRLLRPSLITIGGVDTEETAVRTVIL